MNLLRHNNAFKPDNVMVHFIRALNIEWPSVSIADNQRVQQQFLPPH